MILHYEDFAPRPQRIEMQMRRAYLVPDERSRREEAIACWIVMLSIAALVLCGIYEWALSGAGLECL